jgi:hypothetical protein
MAAPSRDLLAITGVGPWGGLIAGLVWLAAAFSFSWRNPKRSGWMWLGGVGVGMAVAMGWWFNYLVSTQSFEPIPVQSLTFSGPSAEWLMRVLASPAPRIGFEFGLCCPVYLPARSWVRGWAVT